MAWTLIDSASIQGTGQATAKTTPAKNFTGANLIVVVLSSYTSGVISAIVTDSNSNTYTGLTTQNNADDPALYSTIFYTISPTTNGTDTVTVTPGGGQGDYPGMVVYAFSCGGAPTFSAQVGAGTSGGGTTLQAGSIGASGDLVVEGVTFYTNNVSSIDGSFSAPVSFAYSAGNSMGVGASFKEVSGAVNPTWTFAGSNTASAKAASFTPPFTPPVNVGTTLRSTQEYLNAKAGTVGLTKQQALARLTGLPETTTMDILWNAYAGTSAVSGRTAQEASNIKVGGNPVTTYTKQESSRRL